MTATAETAATVDVGLIFSRSVILKANYAEVDNISNRKLYMENDRLF